MRILQAHSRHATQGGADHVMERERQLLVAAGHEVRQYVADAAGDVQRPAWRQATDAVWNPASHRAVKTVIREWRPDVLHVHTPFPVLSPAAFWAARSEGVATVGTVHSYRYSCIAATLRRDGAICEDCIGSRTKLAGVRHACYHDSRAASAALTTSLALHHAAGTFSRAVGRFLPLTDFAKDLLVRDGIPAERIQVKPNCVDDPGEPVDPAGRKPVVLFAGRLVAEKGIATMLAGWRLADRAGCRLLVAGDGPLRHLVEQAADEDPSVELLGWQSAADLAEIQATARATLVPSEWYEAGPPLVLLEALASGTPVISCDLANISSTVQAAGAGVTFRTGDAVSLADAVSRLLADPAAATAAGLAARELYLRDHTPAASLAALERAYRAAAETGSAGPSAQEVRR
jgi:glycosyltransferase involved in cell wall biosynthesis